VIHYKKNISSLIGGQNRINYKDRDSTTTYTKEELIKDLQIHEVNDINININIFNNNADRNLEVISDFDETKDNKNYNSTNKKNNNSSNKKEILIKNEYTNSIPKNIFNVGKKGKTSTESKKNDSNISNNKDIDNIINLSHDHNNKLKTFNKADNYSGNKTLRKKYERTEFKFRYVDNLLESNIYNQNNYIMKNLINKFEQCSPMTENKKNYNINNEKDNEYMKSNLNSENKINETFIVKDSENGLILNLDVSLNNNSFLKNIQDNEITSISGKNENSKNSIKSALNSIKSYINNYNSIEKKENISMDKIPNNLSFNLNDSLNIKKIINCPKTTEYKNKKRKEFATPDRGNNDVKIHTFILDSPFDNNDTNALNTIKNSSDKILSNGNEVNDNNTLKSKQKEELNEEAQPQSVYDFVFYQKLLQAEEKMAKICQIFAKNELILNTELRLEILLWMMKTCEEFAFKRDTYHNACYYFDMYLINTSSNKIYDKSELELIGLTCIVISAKIEEIQLPRLKEYAELLSNKYNIKSIIEMEKKICSSLSWRLIIVTKNIWLSWYMCQWDLFIDTIDNIKQDLLQIIKEDEILYYKKPNDNSYYNFRKISQLIDIMTLDFYSYNFEPRKLIAASFFILLCHNYKLNYNFTKRKINNNTILSNLLFNLYNKFITQSFDYNFNDERIQKAIKYCYNYINFPFIFDLPLLYQVHQSKLDGDSYEDFLSYQTNNDNFYKIIKERININKMMKIKKKPIINNNKNNNSHRKTVSSYNNSKINNKK
jgi:hypothetical protein